MASHISLPNSSLVVGYHTSRILTDRPSALKEDEQAHAQTQLGIRGAQLFSKLFECWVVDRCAERGGEGGKGDHDEDDGLRRRTRKRGRDKTTAEDQSVY